MSFDRSRGLVLADNILCAGSTLAFRTPGAIAALRRCLLYSGRGQVVQGDHGLDFHLWQPLALAADCCYDDPLFREPAHGDFAPRPCSPLLRMGLRPPNTAAAGPRIG
jgi:hypothetical protein